MIIICYIILALTFPALLILILLYLLKKIDLKLNELITIILTFALIIATDLATIGTLKNADATVESTNALVEDNKASNRPYIGIENIILNWTNKNEATLNLIIKNYGKIPAQITDVEILVDNHNINYEDGLDITGYLNPGAIHTYQINNWEKIPKQNHIIKIIVNYKNFEPYEATIKYTLSANDFSYSENIQNE